MSTEAQPQQVEPTEKSAKKSLQKGAEAVESQEPTAGGEEHQPEQQQEQQEQPQQHKHARRSWAEVVRSEPPQQQEKSTEQKKSNKQQEQQQRESKYPVGKAGEAEQGPEQPREKELSHFAETPVERQIKEQKEPGIEPYRSEMTDDEKAELIGVVRDEEEERSRLIEEDRRAEEDLRQREKESFQMSQKLQDQEQQRRILQPDENRQRFMLARKISASLVKERKIISEQSEELKDLGEKSEIDDRTSRIALAGGYQEESSIESWQEGAVQHTSDPDRVKDQEDAERNRRIKDKSGLERQRQDIAHKFAEVFKQQAAQKVLHDINLDQAKQQEEAECKSRTQKSSEYETQRQMADVSKQEEQLQPKAQEQKDEGGQLAEAWEAGAVLHTSTPHLAKSQEESERKSRLKDESGFEHQREETAHKVAEVFKHKEEEEKEKESSSSESSNFQQQEESERQTRVKDESGLEHQREEIAHQVAGMFKKQTGATEPWVEGQVQHTSDPDRIKKDEEEERERRLQDKDGTERDRENVAHKVAEGISRYTAQISAKLGQGIAIKQQPGGGGDQGTFATGGQQQAATGALLHVSEAEDKEQQERMEPETQEQRQETAQKLAQAMRDEQGLEPRYPEMVVPATVEPNVPVGVNIETKEEHEGPSGRSVKVQEERLSNVQIPNLDVKIDIKESK